MSRGGRSRGGYSRERVYDRVGSVRDGSLYILLKWLNFLDLLNFCLGSLEKFDIWGSTFTWGWSRVTGMIRLEIL